VSVPDLRFGLLPFGFLLVHVQGPVRGVQGKSAVDDLLGQVGSVIEDDASLFETLLPGGIAIDGSVNSADCAALPPAPLPSPVR